MSKTKESKKQIAKAFKLNNMKSKFYLLKEYYENLEAASELLITCDKDFYNYYFRLFRISFNNLKKAKQKQ